MNNLQSRRKQVGLSQNQLADKVGMSVRTLQDYEQFRLDINKAAADMVLKLANALKCKPEDIMNQEE